jgi:xanthine dehydrogenase accessory factor
MKDQQQILQLWAEAESSGETAVLATVVKTRGSSYRLPGARLLLTSRGRYAGSISGGCLEDDLLKKAWWLTEKGPAVRRYDTTPEDEVSSSGFGLGCSGIIHVLLERLSPGHAEVLNLIQNVRRERHPAVIAHLIAPAEAVGRRLLIDTQGAVSHNLAERELADALEKEARFALSEHASRTIHLNHTTEVFLEVLVPAARLLVFGAGNDAVPLVGMAHYLGWSVHVFDGRAHYARRDKFPRADKVAVRSAAEPMADLAIDPWTAAVLMTHSYSQDLAFLQQLAGQPLRYLGLLGPRKRTSQLLADAGLDMQHIRAALHSPMGLDIGADGPEQVALAAIAEIQATLNGREGGLLRQRSGPIHARDAATDPESLWAQSIACA